MTQPDQTGADLWRAGIRASAGTRAPVLRAACRTYNPYYDGPLDGGAPAAEKSAEGRSASVGGATRRRRELAD
jgi:hypothetical protein